jgi:hypothetical protein
VTLRLLSGMLWLLLVAPSAGAQSQPVPKSWAEKAASAVSAATRAIASLPGAAMAEQQIRVLNGSEVGEPLTRLGRTKAAFVAVTGLLAVTLIVGIATLILAEGPLLSVARAAARDVSGSFWLGLLWQFLAVPLLAVGSAALAITLIGIFAIPFLAIAWTLAYAGALTLGLLAVAYLAGRGIGGRGNATSTRGIELRSLLIGLGLLSIVWLAAAAVVAVPYVGIFTRLIALALTWAAATVGLGAVVRSRGGRRVEDAESTAETAVPLWQTPTPVGGVVAARLPVTVRQAADAE